VVVAAERAEAEPDDDDPGDFDEDKEEFGSSRN
jgi:hypothetical protein